ncbi:MAG TPA: hypothetical protein VKR32_19535 [Puia sp.]|nr:hypothetical protein [Puia sp.]
MSLGRWTVQADTLVLSWVYFRKRQIDDTTGPGTVAGLLRRYDDS